MAIASWTRAAAAAALSAVLSLAAAAPQTFGSRQLEIPEPTGFAPASTQAPQLFELSTSFVPDSNRLAEFYVLPQDAQALLAGKIAVLPRYFQLQVPRAMDGKPISLAEFRSNSTDIERALEASMKQAQAQAGDLLEKANASVKQKVGTDPGVSVSDIGYHGIFRREDWGIFFTMSSKVGATNLPTDRMFCAGALAVLNHQVVYFYTYSLERTPADRDWAQRSLSAWVDATRVANPDDPAQQPTGGGNNFWTRTLIFALLGGVIGALYGRWRKNRGA